MTDRSNHKAGGRPVALVTGSSRGLGREIALAFAAAGWSVVVNGCRSPEAADAVSKDARQLGADAIAIMADVGDRAGRDRLVEAALEWGGRLDCLVNNAAVDVGRPVVRLSEDDWDQVMEIDLLAPMALARSAAEVMEPGGLIVNIVSFCGLAGCPRAAAYSTAKAALTGLTRAEAPRFVDRRLRINAIAPGYMPTDLGRATPAAMDIAREQHAMGTLSQPAATAAFILHLYDMPGITGQVFNLDGRIR